MKTDHEQAKLPAALDIKHAGSDLELLELEPKTDLGKRLIAIRKKYIEGGGRLFSLDKIQARPDIDIPDYYDIEPTRQAFDAGVEAMIPYINQLEEQLDSLSKIEAEYIELRELAQAVVDRWDSPLWKDIPHTAEYINALREVLR